MMNTPVAFENLEPASPVPHAAPSCRYICFSPFTYDLRRQLLYRGGMSVKLPTKVHEILLVLIEKSGEVVTREALRERLWPADVHVNFDANVNTTVNKLRQILGDSPEDPAFIETIPRQGYSFIAKIDYTDVPPPGAIRAKPLSGAPEAPLHSPQDAVSVIDSFRNSRWFTAAVVTLFVLGVFVGATLVYLAHR